MCLTGRSGFPISVVTPPSDKETRSYPFFVSKEKSFSEKVMVYDSWYDSWCSSVFCCPRIEIGTTVIIKQLMIKTTTILVLSFLYGMWYSP